MTSFYVSDLAKPLFALAIACYVLLIVWAEVRKRNPLIVTIAESLDEQQKKALAKGRHYRLLLLGMLTVILCFSLNPYVYQFLMPIHILDIPLINVTGFTMIFIALVRTAVIQLEFDQLLFKECNRQKESVSLAIGDYAKEIQLGYFMIILGIALVLANAVSLVLLSVTCVISYRSRQMSY